MVGMSDRVESLNLEKGNAQLDNSKLYAEARQSFMDAAAGPSVKVERLSTGETAEILTGALARGTFTEGYKEVTEHPGRLAAEGIGGYALMVAMRGPAWARVPAMAAATVGLVGYGSQAVTAYRDAERIVGGMDKSNVDQSKAALESTLGPLGFSTAFMLGTARLGYKDAELMPREMPASLARPIGKLNTAVKELAFDTASLMQPAPALAGVPGGRLHINEIRPSAEAKNTVMAMVGDASGNSKIITGRGIYGEATHQVRLNPGERVEIPHTDGTQTTVDASGKVMVGFNGGEARLIELGYPVKSITASDYANGVRHYRVNDAPTPNMEVSADGHVIKAVVGQGDHLQLIDNVPNNFTYFPHADGSRSWIQSNGRVVFDINGRQIEHTFPENLAHIRLVERVDGSKQFRFLDENGALLPHVVELPAAKSVAQDDNLTLTLKALQSQQRRVREPNSGKPFEVYRIEPSSVMPQVERPRDAVGGMIPRWPTSQQRLEANVLAGVSTRTMRGNNLESPADMELAMQDNSWLVSRYLNHLNSHQR